uniref:Uncharacterized protein n=1 Tax=Pectinaria gouldii TaxID=260746 RepID=A0A0K1R0Q4_PECGU|nr:hypothetical protein [Pectinaria gouldii]
MKQSVIILLVACVVIAFHLEAANAQFSFSLPGKWGSGKRGFQFSLPGKWGGKRAYDMPECSQSDPRELFELLTMLEAEAQKVSECLAKAELERVDDKH